MSIRQIIKYIVLILTLITFLFCFFGGHLLQAKEWEFPDFNLEKPENHTIHDEISNFQRSMSEDLDQFIFFDLKPQSKDQITLYLRNHSSTDLFLTDITTHLDNKLTHYNFALDDAEILYRNTIQKFSLFNIPSGEHLLQLKFLFYQLLHQEKEMNKQKELPIKGCTFLSDAYCLHQKEVHDTRVKKECSFNINLKRRGPYSIIISFNDSDIPQILALPSKAMEKLKVDLEIARGFYHNQSFLKCLRIISIIKKDFSHFPQFDEALFLQAECFFHLQMFTKATHMHLELRRKFPKSAYLPLSLLRSLMIHYLNGNYDKAIEDFVQFAEFWNKDFLFDPARFIAAKSYFHKKKYAQAEDSLKKISPGSVYYPEARYLLSICFLDLKKYDPAASSLQEVIRSASAMTGYSVMKEMQNILEYGLSKDKLIDQAHLQLGEALFRRQHYDAALKEFESIFIDSDYYTSALMGKGLILLRQKRIDAIENMINNFSRESLESKFLADARLSLAWIFRQNREFKKAKTLYELFLTRCQEGINALNTFNNNVAEIKELAHCLLNGELKAGVSSTMKFIFQKVQNEPGLTQSIPQWNTILKLEEALDALESLLLEPFYDYHEKIQILAELKNFSHKLQFPSKLTPTSRTSQIYKKIKTKRAKILEIKKASFVQAQKSLKHSIAVLTKQFNELQDLAFLEGLVCESEEKFSPLEENKTEDYIHALEKITGAHEEFFALYPYSPYRERLLFQLGESYYKKAALEFQIQLKLAESKKNPADFLMESRPNFDQAIKVYGKILADFPKGSYREKALYALGYIYQEEGAIILAKDLYQKLIVNFPQSPLIPESYLRLGEISFDRNKFAEATGYYERSITFGELPEEYRNNIFYKLGWSYLQQNQYEKAFDIFVSLADQYAAEGKVKILDEISYQLAKIFSEPASSNRFKELLEGKPYHFLVLQELADILFDQRKTEEALTICREAIAQSPLHPSAPLLQSKIVKGYMTLNNTIAANEAREKLIVTYGGNSNWWKKNRDEKAREQVTSFIEESIRNSTLFLLESKNKKDYLAIIDFYKRNLDYFPTGEQVYIINFFLAECLFRTDQYEKALVEYEKTIKNREFDQFAEDAAYKQVLCLEKIINQKLPQADKSAEKWSEDEKKFVSACDYFWQKFPDHKNLPEIFYKKGELYFQKNKLNKAAESFSFLLQNYPKSSVKIPAMKMLAKIYYTQQQFDLAAEIYAQEVAEYSRIINQEKRDDLEKVKEARQGAVEMEILAKYKAVEQLKEKDPLDAAKKLESMAKTLGEMEIADGALFEAANIYKEQGKVQKAQDIFLKIVRKYPKSDYAPPSLWQIGLYQEENGQLIKAAQNFERLYFSSPKFSKSKKALYKAGIIYEKLENWPRVVRIFSLYHAKFQLKPALSLEVLFRRGYGLMKMGNAAKSNAAFYVVIDQYERYKKHDDTLAAYYPARAQFLISEQMFDDYNALVIREVNDKAIEPKLALLKTLIASYTKASDYNIAEWTTPSLYKMGFALDSFALQLYQRPEQDSDTKDDTAYLLQIQLYQKIIEFFEKAVLFYQKNIQLAKKNTIRNTWIEKSEKSRARDFWQMGQINEKIYFLIKEAPIPEMLDETEKLQYRKALWLKALPYNKQAVEVYEKNTLAFQENIPFNEWIKSSYQRLMALKPKKYLRGEKRLLAEDKGPLSHPEKLLIR